MVDPTQDTVEFSQSALFADSFFAPPSDPTELRFGAVTHEGKVRSNNEDHFAILRRRRTIEIIKSNLQPHDLSTPDDHSYALVVADGIGGARFGELASRVALKTMLELTCQATSWVMKLTDLDAQQIRERVEAYLHRIQNTLLDCERDDPELSGMGTTWTSAHIIPPRAVIVHLGDSRAYLIRQRRLIQISHDETMAQALVDAGMAPEEVENLGHVLLNHLGGGKENVTAQIHEVEFGPGDQLLVCSDGLTDMVPESRIEQEVHAHQDPQSACDALLALALEAGGRDNVTIVLASASEAK
ncbi:MAG: serine/threonine-protein phosphatase [Planctomycetota bacterium]|nr:MAG: serine/threonine-protein phosphatase [Planctomycetota bacterium]REJ92913.1 MAG: serine/threonine-protein phosphatase [Planctomycetota bacterium]REK26158.1 MAG: serine/threonine-protein phosphatase [Planctomycetota bacterium]REK33527.1 MAG: serine/threonine-protein phosphatase [Planctomycetota bacterium]